MAVKIEQSQKDKKTAAKKRKKRPKKPEVLDEVIKTAEEEKPPDLPEEEVGKVVEKVHEEIEEKKEEKNNGKGADYTPADSGYKTYGPETAVPEQIISISDDIIVDEDLTTHRFRKDTDPREYLERCKYNKPWDNPFLCYIKNCFDDRAKRVSVMAKKGFRSAIHGVAGAYHALFGWIYRRK